VATIVSVTKQQHRSQAPVQQLNSNQEKGFTSTNCSASLSGHVSSRARVSRRDLVSKSRICSSNPQRIRGSTTGNVSNACCAWYTEYYINLKLFLLSHDGVCSITVGQHRKAWHRNIYHHRQNRSSSTNDNIHRYKPTYRILLRLIGLSKYII